MSTLPPPELQSADDGGITYDPTTIAISGMDDAQAAAYRRLRGWYISPEDADNLIKTQTAAATAARERSESIIAAREWARLSPMPAGIVPTPPPVKITRHNDRFAARAVKTPRRGMTVAETIAASRAAFAAIIARQEERAAASVALFRHGGALSPDAAAIMRHLKRHPAHWTTRNDGGGQDKEEVRQ